MSNNEKQYLSLVRHVLEHGNDKADRTKTGTFSVFGYTMRFSLAGGALPLLTTKKVFWRGVCEELFWFIKGSTNSKDLEARGVNIWKGNGERAFLDKVGLGENEEGDLGPVYGFQWRHFGAEYKGFGADYGNKGVDQLTDCIEQIRKDPNSRRIVMSAWNPSDLKKMALPPCHMFCQFYVCDGKLSCSMYQRSADIGLGVPFNIASYALLLHLVAHVTGLEPGEFVHVLGDAHIYKNHVEPLKMQLERDIREQPLLRIKKKTTNIEDIAFEDLELVGYNPHPAIPMELSV